jgi:two-component system cell cycle response regulator DivK
MMLNDRPLALVIDDSDDTRDMYATALYLDGFAVEEACDGQEALHKARAVVPDVIITDFLMPMMDGWEMIRHLRADNRTRAIPIIACSGASWPTAGHGVKADVVLQKPYPLDLLLLEVHGLLARRAA